MGLTSLLLAVALAAEPVTLGQLAWIVGHWRGTTGAGAVSEEAWQAAEGDSMIGTWRLVAGGEARVFELLLIVQEEAGPVFRLRHFNRDGSAWEEKDKPLELPLVRHAPGEAVFEGTDLGGGPLRLTYRKLGEDGLSVLLEKGSQKPSEFRFTRVR